MKIIPLWFLEKNYLCIQKEKFGGHVSYYARFIRINQAVNIKHAVHPVWFHKILLTLLMS